MALHLGLRVNPTNDQLQRSLTAIRKEDPVSKPVRARDGSDHAVRNRQHQAGYDLIPATMPPFVMALMMGKLEAVKAMWTPELVKFQHGGVKNPIMHFPILGAQRFPDWGEVEIFSTFYLKEKVI